SYRGCWHVVSRGFLWRYRHLAASSLLTGVYDPKAFIPHASSLAQACAHCPKFPTAASRRSLGRVSVPVWLTILSDQLPVVALVGRYLTNELIGRGPIPQCLATFLPRRCRPRNVPGISPGFPRVSPSAGQVAHVLLTRSPLELIASCPATNPRSTCMFEARRQRSS